MTMIRKENLEALAAVGNAPLPVIQGEGTAMKTLRQEALDSFISNGLELRGREEWKYSDVAHLMASQFTPYLGEAPAVSASDENLAGGGLRLVFINGVFSSQASKLGDLPEGVALRPLAGVSSVPGFGALAGFDKAPYVALNTAYWTDGLCLELADGAVLDQPVHLHFISDGRTDERLVAVRNFIRAGRHSQATIIEHYDRSVAGECLHLPLTEVFCSEGSDIRHLKVVREGEGTLHLGSTHVFQGTGSKFTSREFAMAGAMIRREVHLDLAGEGANCDLTALSMGAGDERRDMRTRVNHKVSGCETHELYKGLFDDRSKGVFDGCILVERDAQQTNAHQTNRNLLLSDDAVSYSIPRLEIYADDVKCSHGSTTGQLMEDQVFFLRSRGFDDTTARVMLAKAFAFEILEGVDDENLKDDLNSFVTDRLAQSLGGSAE